MAISTKEGSKGPSSKREKIAALLEKHIPLFEKLGVSNPKFIPKMAYPDQKELIISFYPSEVNSGQDVYTEFVSRDYEPEDPERRLFKWIYNPEYATEYRMSDPHPTTGDRRFLVPVDELVDVTKEILDKEQEKTGQTDAFNLKDAPDADSDQPYANMTMRDYAAIQWKQPVSHKKWLNELIIKQFGNGRN
jgi:hypothetical protein